MTQADETIETQVEKPEVTEESVKYKIKQMIVSLLNTGVRSGVYTPNMISDKHSFEDLELTEHEKLRLILQCDELYGINLGPEALGLVLPKDLASMVFAAIQNKENPPSVEQTDNTGA